MKPFNDPHATLISHEAAGKRYRISGILRLDQPLHVGSGRSSAVTDSAVVRNHAGQPIIPGSSFRGALRSRCERLADAFLPGQICFLYEDPRTSVACVSVRPDVLRTSDGDLRDESELWSLLPHHLCPSCRLFGASAYWASKMRIPDLALMLSSSTGAVTMVRHGVGIHRDTQTAAPAIKYDQEVVTANASFALEILIENPDEDDLSLLALGLAELVNGRMALGGNSSRGLGGCRLEEGQVEWVDLGAPAELVAFLSTGSFSQKNRQTLSEWLGPYLQRWLED